VAIQVTSASASVTLRLAVAAYTPQVGSSRPKRVKRSSESGSGMKPIMFSIQMKRNSAATYGNQRPADFFGRFPSAICDWRSS